MSIDPRFMEFATFGSDEGQTEEIEILGPHLRVSGRIALGRFKRLSDLANHSQGYVRMQGARLLRRNGDPTNLELAELLVNRDEITFIGQRPAAASDGSTASGADAAASGDTAAARTAPQSAGFSEFDRPTIEKQSRRFVIFTPGHTLTGDVHVFHEMTLSAFLESSDPRFVAMTNVRARSLADRRVISHFDLLLVNKTQMIAAAEADRAAALAD